MTDTPSIKSLKEDIAELKDAVGILSAKLNSKSPSSTLNASWKPIPGSDVVRNTPKRKQEDDRLVNNSTNVRGTKAASEVVKTVPPPAELLWIYVSAFEPSTSENDIVKLTKDCLNLSADVEPKVIRSLSVGVMYLPPDRKSDSNSINNHISSIGDVLSRLEQNDLALVLGDYNQSGLILNVSAYDHPTIDVIRSNIPASCCTLLDGFSLHNLMQINKVTNINSRILDFVLVNEAAVTECSVIEALEPLIGLDNYHPALEIHINLSIPVRFDNTTEVRELDFRRTDFVALRFSLAQADWQFLDTCPSIDEAVNYFEEVVSRVISDYVPLSRPAPKPAWSNARLRHLKRLRSMALRKYCNTRNFIAKYLLSVASKEYRTYNRFLYKMYTRRIQDNLRRNPRQFWSFVKTKRKEDGLPLEIHLGNRIACSSFEKCKLLVEHFRNVFNDRFASSIQIGDAIRDTPRDIFDFDIATISSACVESAIKKLKFSNTAGPDGIPSCILKNCSSEFIIPLSKLFNISIQQGVFPTRWKYSFMFPVYKKGDKQNVVNYRGITSLNACSKIFEIIINDALFS
ncbi:uncharacterized protein LOC129761295 [Toxorhynchites rutilus septentrionalis]|uniref:uncharacterized protein LOC129761295 n=1 Tax=Toxorhynchites rutilus septentrionalis TaxID=329112 RepID=UPI00247ACBF6|nr:uncharacterized protein LOC129761295 [Toxorhynchites rutilus septentrionalis]